MVPKKCVVKIWRAHPGCVSPAQWRLLSGLLDGGEQAQAQRFRHAADRQAYVLAHGLRRLALAFLMDLPAHGAAALQFKQDAAGRPFLPAAGRDARWFFSHSHTRQGVLFAASQAHPVGIDIEPKVQTLPVAGLLQSFLAWPADAGLKWNIADGFADGWTALEAFLKSLGCGLSGLDMQASGLAPGSAPAYCHVLGLGTGQVGEGQQALRLGLHRKPPRRAEALVLRVQAPPGCTAALAVRQPVWAALPQLHEYSLDTDAALLRRLC